MKSQQKILPNIYRDSVALMQISSKLCDLPGVIQASAIMATAANIELLLEAGLIKKAIEPAPNDLLIAIQGDDDNSIAVAFDQAEEKLNEAPSTTSNGNAAALAPQSIEMALDEFPEAQLALISCPGEYAGAEAKKALQLGLDVMIFSDNVSFEDERALKELAIDLDKLVMGPDCGTAILNGVPLGFANVVAKGDIGIVAASGTGLQQVSCLVDQLGAGISQAIGTGGRDLNAKIGGLSMLKGILTLSQDSDTKVIVLVSKPPSSEIAEKVLAEASTCGKPVVVNFLGADLATLKGENIYPVETLEEAAHTAAQLSKEDTPSSGPLPRHSVKPAEIKKIAQTLSDSQKYVRGLYSGGTFSYEAMLLLDQEIGPMNSSSPLNAEHKLNDIWSSTGNTIIDLGDDLFTRGRPHPMIDHRLRNDRILQEAEDPETAVILLDVVIGHGSHNDPAGEMVASIKTARKAANKIGNNPAFVTFVCGTYGDPQNFAAQENKLRDAGAIVLESNAQAVRLTSDILLAVGETK
jgi:succinyl-CoA synthetase alpha subunit